MKGRWISVVLTLTLMGGVLVALPAQRSLAAGIASITIDHYPAYIPTDASSPCSSGGGTPFAVRVTVAGDANQNYAIKIRLGSGACTWRPDTGSWTTDSTAFTALTRGTIESDGDVSFWLYGRANANATTSLTVRARGCNADWTSCADNIDSSPKTVTLIDMSTSGGWLEETEGTTRSARAIAVKDGLTVVGLYVAEDNGVNEGYPGTFAVAGSSGLAPDAEGYYKVAVPDCANCGYTIETWELTSPGTSVGQVNTMGEGTCPSSVTAGATTSLDSCGTPTAIALGTLKATPLANAFPTLLPALGLLVLGGVALYRRRRG